MNPQFFAYGKEAHAAVAQKDVAQAVHAPRTPFVVKLTDNPGSFAGLEVEINQVSVYSPVLGWVAMERDIDFVDVLELTNGREVQLAHCPVYIHDYFGFSKIKIAIGDRNRLVTWDKNGQGDRRNQRVHCFYRTQHEVVIPLTDPDMGQLTNEVLLDFDVAQSVKPLEQGYSLDPRIKVVADRRTGISGKISSEGHHVVFATDFRNSYSCFTDENGRFLMRGMKPGAYSILAYSHRNDIGQPIARLFVEDVKVFNGSITDLDL